MLDAVVRREFGPLALFLALFPLVCGLVVWGGNFAWPWLRGETPRGTLTLHADGSVSYALGNTTLRSRVPPVRLRLREAPPDLLRALLYQEDQAFFAHGGYSVRESLAALRDAVTRGRRLRGASTLTQQTARSLFFGTERSYARKLRELRLARALEFQLGKRAILELYLNHAYWGAQPAGVEAAARFYFRKPAARLTRDEAVFLVALLPEPNACGVASRCRSKSVAFRTRRLLRALETGARFPL